MNITLLRVNGRSMLPTLSPGTYVLAVAWPFMRVKLNDVVVVATPKFGTIIKRVIGVDKKHQRFYLSGDNIRDSISTGQIGLQSRDALLGKVCWQSQ